MLTILILIFLFPNIQISFSKTSKNTYKMLSVQKTHSVWFRRKPSSDSNEMFRLQNYKSMMSSTDDSIHSSSSRDSISDSSHSTPAWHAECLR